MSDNESSYSSDNDSENSDNEEFVVKKKPGIKKISINPAVINNYDNYDSLQEDAEDPEDIDEDDDEEEDDEDDVAYENEGVENEVKHGGSAEDDDDEDKDSDDENEENPVAAKNNPHPINNLQKYDSDDDPDEYDDNYLQKFDSEITKNYITKYHPECLHNNYEEIAIMTRVVRDSSNIIIDPLHRTIPYLTKYEKARILGQRAKQIECGAKPLVNVPEHIVDSYIIAQLELEQKKIPFIIRRPIPSGGSEYWNLKDLEIIAF